MNCEWAVATTNPHPRLPLFDRESYDLWVEFEADQRLKAIAATANAVYIGAAAARGLIDAGAPIARGLQALEVQRIAGELRRSGIAVRIRPDFPWPLE